MAKIKYSINYFIVIVSDDNCEKVDGIVSEEVEMSVRNCEEDKCDKVSDFLYDRPQKEVVKRRKSQEEKDGVLIAKEDEMKVPIKDTPFHFQF